MRLTQDQRDRIERAASLRGVNLTQWVTENLINDANRDILEESIIHLSNEAYDDFVSALDDPMPKAAIELLNTKPVWQ